MELLKVEKCVFKIILGMVFICVVNAQARHKELEDLRPGQRKNLADFKNKVLPLLTHDWMKQDIYLIKFLSFNRFNIAKAEAQLKEMLKFWKEVNVDEEIRISPNGPSQNYADIQAEWPIYVDGYDKEGRPICELPLGAWDLRKAAVAGKTKRLINHVLLNCLERAEIKIREQQAKGKNVTQWIVMENLEGFQVATHLCPSCIPVVVAMAAGIDKYFPNSPHGFWLPNTPDAFHTLLGFVRPVLSVPTRNAIRTFTANEKEWKPFLYKRIDISQLPTWAGGPKQHDFTRIHIAIMVMCWAFGCTFVIDRYVEYRNINSLVSVFNEVLELADTIGKAYPTNSPKAIRGNSLFVQNLLLYSLVTYAAILPFSGTVVGVLSGFDAGYFLVDAIFPYWRNHGLIPIVVVFAFRMSTAFLAIAEFCRSVSFLLCTLIVYLRRARNVLDILLTRIIEPHRACLYFIHIVLLIRKVERLLYIVVYITLTPGFWGLVISCWVSVKCSISSIGYPFYVLFLLIFCFLVIAHCVGLPAGCRNIDANNQVISVHRRKARSLYATSRTKWNKIVVLQTQAMAPFRVKLGPFWYLGMKFLPGYYDLITQRCFDAIMIVDSK